MKNKVSEKMVNEKEKKHDKSTWNPLLSLGLAEPKFSTNCFWKSKINERIAYLD